MFEKGLVGDMDLSLLQNHGHRNHDREFFRIASKVVGHREDRSISLTYEHDLRGFVEQLGVSLGHVEAAECEQLVAVPGGHDRQRCK